MYLEERADGPVVADAHLLARAVLELPDLAARHVDAARALSRLRSLGGTTHRTRTARRARARTRTRDGVRVAAVKDAVAPGGRALLLAACTSRACVGLKYCTYV